MKKYKSTFTLILIYIKTCQQFGVSVAEVNSHHPDRQRAVVKQVAQYVARMRTNHSLKTIGRVIGGNTEATVRYSIKTIDGLIRPIRGRVQDDNLREQVNNITKIF